ncbi:protein of unknown function [Xenorhabdus bovienii]|uniref:Uncharacterized protein n=1 Tax=Xenorhabdus bovienii TaxID=40576 RepID=A0A0B6XFI4_XENBV|nr:protein of unknown function [Xenorhabdus bovienii]
MLLVQNQYSFQLNKHLVLLLWHSLLVTIGMSMSQLHVATFQK